MEISSVHPDTLANLKAQFPRITMMYGVNSTSLTAVDFAVNSHQVAEQLKDELRRWAEHSIKTDVIERVTFEDRFALKRVTMRIYWSQFDPTDVTDRPLSPEEAAFQAAESSPNDAIHPASQPEVKTSYVVALRSFDDLEEAEDYARKIDWTTVTELPSGLTRDVARDPDAPTVVESVAKSEPGSREAADLLEEARVKLEEVIDLIEQAVRSTSAENRARAYILPHLNDWAAGATCPCSIQSLIDELA